MRRLCKLPDHYNVFVIYDDVYDSVTVDYKGCRYTVPVSCNETYTMWRMEEELETAVSMLGTIVVIDGTRVTTIDRNSIKDYIATSRPSNISDRWLMDNTRCPNCGAHNIVHNELEFDTPSLGADTTEMIDSHRCLACGSLWHLEFSLKLMSFKTSR